MALGKGEKSKKDEEGRSDKLEMLETNNEGSVNLGSQHDKKEGLNEEEALGLDEVQLPLDTDQKGPEEEEEEGEESLNLKLDNFLKKCEKNKSNIEGVKKSYGDCVGDRECALAEANSLNDSRGTTVIALNDDDRATDEVVLIRKEQMPKFSEPYNPFKSNDFSESPLDQPPGFEKLSKPKEGPEKGSEPNNEPGHNSGMMKSSKNEKKKRKKKMSKKSEKKRILSSEEDEDEEADKEARRTWELGEAIGLRTTDVTQVY